MIQFLTFVLVIVAPLAWLASELQERRWLRIFLGSTAMAACFGVASLFGALQMWNANAWYGNASKELVDATIAELEAGNQAHVVACLKEMQRQFYPTYENRAKYDILVAETVERMKSVNRPVQGPVAPQIQTNQPHPD